MEEHSESWAHLVQGGDRLHHQAARAGVGPLGVHFGEVGPWSF
jgi:hypothetical protein